MAGMSLCSIINIHAIVAVILFYQAFKPCFLFLVVTYRIRMKRRIGKAKEEFNEVNTVLFSANYNSQLEGLYASNHRINFF